MLGMDLSGWMECKYVEELGLDVECGVDTQDDGESMLETSDMFTLWRFMGV